MSVLSKLFEKFSLIIISLFKEFIDFKLTKELESFTFLVKEYLFD